MQKVVEIILFITLLQTCFAPPVTQNKKESDANEDESNMNGLEDYMEYHRYLKEVVNALESDPDFRQKLEKADENEIKSGKIAEQLEFVSHHVRTRLDEIKRIELQRLKELAEQKKKLEDSNSIDEDPIHHHLDHDNPHTFEIEDLKKLIAKTTQDLAEVDRKRREQFKQYELEKEYQKQEKLNHTNGEEREKLEKQFKELEEKHKKHEKLHQPGHKAQLEEVWEEQDQMQQDFNPKTFFMLHDLDGNGLWDQDEVKSLFIKELDKMYQQGAPEDDMRERIEEMERMRESVFKEMDKNRDGFIDYNEFWAQTHSKDFNQDHGWQTVDEQRPYTDEELAEYIRQHEAANQFYQAHPGAYQQVPPGGYQQIPPGGYQQVPPGGYQQASHGGYQQVPPGGYQQVPPGGYQQVPQGYQQVPQGYQPNPPAGYQPPPPGAHQQVPVSQQPQGGYQQVPSGGYHPNAIPPHGQVHNGQVPQNAPHPGQVSQHELNTNEVHAPQGYQQQSGQPNYQNQVNQHQPQAPNQQPVPQQPVQNQPPQAHQPEQVHQQPQQMQQQPQQMQQQPQQMQQQPQQINQQQPPVNQQAQQQQANLEKNQAPPNAA